MCLRKESDIVGVFRMSLDKFASMSSDEEIHAAFFGGVYLNFSFGIGESCSRSRHVERDILTTSLPYGYTRLNPALTRCWRLQIQAFCQVDYILEAQLILIGYWIKANFKQFKFFSLLLYM